MRITTLAGGVGGARFLRGLLAHFDRTPNLSDASVTVIGNTGDDINLFGLRVCPDLDTLMYTLGGAVHEERVGAARTRPTPSRVSLRPTERNRNGSASATSTSGPTSPVASGLARVCLCPR